MTDRSTERVSHEGLSLNRLDRILQDHPKPREFARGYISYVSEMLEALDEDAIAALIDVLTDARDQGAQIFFIGNGGSAATASHFANDIAFGSGSWEKPFRAVSLTDNIAVLTALANDYDYGQIFTAQLRIHMKPGDVVVAVSASGNSQNILSAVEYANRHGGVTVGLTGFDGGALKQLASLAIHVSTEKGEYGPTEDVHMGVSHLVGAYLIGLCRLEEREQ